MKLLETTENKVKTKMLKVYLNVPFKYYRNRLVHCNIVNDWYQRDSKVLYIFVPNVPNKPFCQLLETYPKNRFSENI